MKNENELDQFFKKGLAEPDLPFNELDWEKMEQKLGPQKPKRTVLLWPVAAAGIAASILLVFFLMFQKEKSTPLKDKSILKATVVKPSNSLKEKVSNNETVLGKEKALNKKQLLNKKPDAPIDKTQTVRRLIPQAGLPIEVAITPSNQESIASTVVTNPKSTAITNPVSTVIPEPGFTVITEPVSTTLTNPVSTESINTNNIASITPEVPTIPARTKKSSFKANSRGRLAFSVIAAPDISSSQANLAQKVSTNLGLLATYSLSGKFSLTTGVVYARKLYDYSGASVAAYGNPGKTMETYADCKVLDIPLNLNYRLYQKGLNAISFNTGLSSYIMLNEKYKYVSNDDLGNTNSSVLEIVNQNQHFLGVANIAVSFSRRINNQVSVGIQPFVKIPLTGIGYHDTKLRSTGIAFSLNLNMRQK